MIAEPYLIETVHSLSWADDRRESVNCFVKFNHCKNAVPFNASPNDPEFHGRSLFSRIESGEFGEVSSVANVLYALQVKRRQDMLPVFGAETMNFLLLAIEEGNLENGRGTARGIVLVWGALVEAVMAEIIGLRVELQSPPKTFKRKVDVLRSRGLLSPALVSLLYDLCKVRNCAAHSLRFSAFSHLTSDREATEAYRRLYAEVAEELYHEVSDLLFIARFVFAPAYLSAVAQLAPLLSEKAP